jgi:hypothetical protein
VEEREKEYKRGEEIRRKRERVQESRRDKEEEREREHKRTEEVRRKREGENRRD